MRLSQRCDYALRALVALGSVYPAPTRLSAKAIASQEGIPLRFLEQIMMTLKRSGFVQSEMGAKGGYRLARAPDHITFGAVMRAVDGSLAPIACVDTHGSGRCVEQPHCRFRKVMVRLQEAIAEVVDHTTLAEVLG